MKVHNKGEGRVRIRNSKKGPEDQSDTEIIDEQAQGSASVDQVLPPLKYCKEIYK